MIIERLAICGYTHTHTHTRVNHTDTHARTHARTHIHNTYILVITSVTILNISQSNSVYCVMLVNVNSQ